MNILKRFYKGLSNLEILIKSIRRFDMEITKDILTQNPELVNARDEFDNVAIHICILSKNIDALKLVLKVPNVDMNAYCKMTGNTPIIAAIVSKDIDIVQIIGNDYRVNLELENNFSWNALSASIVYDFEEAYKLLLPISAPTLIKRVDAFNNTLLTKVIMYGRFNWINTTLHYFDLTVEDIEESLSDDNDLLQPSSNIKLEEISNQNIFKIFQSL